MKKILSVMLSVLFVASMFTTVSADLSTQMSFVPTTVNKDLSLVVGAREGTSAGAYSNAAFSLIIGATESSKTVDYKTVLDMSPIRALFSEPFITTLLPAPENSALNNEFNTGAVTTSVNVAITFPAAATITGDLSKKAGEPGSIGTLDAGTGMFSEVSRTLAGNTLTINFKNKDSLTVGELRADVNGLLKDISFTLDDAVAYSADGNYSVSVTLSGSTTIAFTSRTQTVTYSGSSSNLVVATKLLPAGGSGGASTFLTVKFNTNGGTEVGSISVNNGRTIDAPVTTRPGYTFKGWYTDNKFTTPFDFSTKITKNITLYACWDEDAKWFTDVHSDDWFYDIVKYAYANGLMNGVSDTEFAPNMGMTRSMFVTVLYRIEKEPDGDINKIFNDVVQNSWYDKAVAWATENGVTKGVSETEFDPDRIITREQIVTMVYRYAKFKGYDISAAESTDISSFEDADTISEYAVPSFKWAVGTGVIVGKSDVTLCPKDDTTRAEAAAILTRLAKKYN